MYTPTAPLLLLAAVTWRQGTAICPMEWISSGSYCFYLDHGPARQFHESWDACERQGGQMMTHLDQLDRWGGQSPWQDIQGMMGAERVYWIGAIWVPENATWAWRDSHRRVTSLIPEPVTKEYRCAHVIVEDGEIHYGLADCMTSANVICVTGSDFLPPSPSPSPSPDDVTPAARQPGVTKVTATDKPSNNSAVVAAVVTVLLLMLLAGVVLAVCWWRKRKTKEGVTVHNALYGSRVSGHDSVISSIDSGSVISVTRPSRGQFNPYDNAA